MRFLQAFLNARFSGDPRHQRRIDMLTEYEAAGSLPRCRRRPSHSERSKPLRTRDGVASAVGCTSTNGPSGTGATGSALTGSDPHEMPDSRMSKARARTTTELDGGLRVS